MSHWNYKYFGFGFNIFVKQCILNSFYFFSFKCSLYTSTQSVMIYKNNTFSLNFQPVSDNFQKYNLYYTSTQSKVINIDMVGILNFQHLQGNLRLYSHIHASSLIYKSFNKHNIWMFRIKCLLLGAIHL